MKAYAAAFATILCLAGCANYPVAQYAPSDAVRDELKRAGVSQHVAVVDFTASTPGIKSIACRGAGHYTFPKGATVEQYLTDALRKDLRNAGVYDDDAAIKITGNISHFDANSNVLMAAWEFDISVAKGSENFRIKFDHRFKTSWSGERACSAAAEQLVEATQEMTQRVTSNPVFLGWIK